MPFFDLPQSQLETYRSRAVAPADFDAFWATTLEESRAKPLDATFEKVDAGLKLVEAYDVTFSGFGGDKVKGWYLKPAGIAPRGTVVKFIGYGGGRCPAARAPAVADHRPRAARHGYARAGQLMVARRHARSDRLVPRPIPAS